MRKPRMLRRCLPIALILFVLPATPAQDRKAIAAKYIAQEQNDAIRADAVTYLQGCREPACRQLFIAALHDSSWVVRFRAVTSLFPFANSGLIGPFLESLKDSDDLVWIAAVNGLIQIGEPAVPALREAASDSNPFVRQGAIAALGKIGRPRTDAYYPAEFWRLVTECRERRRLGNENGSILLRGLRDEDPNVRRDATAMFSCFEAPEAIDSLLKNANDSDSYTRAAAFAALQGYTDSRIVTVAFEALRDSEDSVRKSAAGLLTGLLTSSHTDMLIALLRDPDSKMRFLVFDLINRLEDGKSDKRLLDEIRARPAELVAWATESEAYGGSALVKILFEFAESSKDEQFVAEIAKILARAYDPALIPLYMDSLRGSRHQTIRRMAADVVVGLLQNVDQKHSEVVDQFITDNDPVVRASAAFYGAKIGDGRAIPVLEQLAKDGSGFTRSAAIFTLSRKFMPAAFDLLSSMLLQGSAGLTAEDSLEICQALKSSGNKAAISSLFMNAIMGQNPAVVESALLGLFYLDKAAALDQFNRMLAGNNQPIRIAAVRGAQFRDSEVEKILIGILSNKAETEEMKEAAFDQLRFSSDIRKDSKIQDVLFTLLKGETIPGNLKRQIVAILVLVAPKMETKMMRDADLCGQLLQIESAYGIQDRERLLPILRRRDTPRSCRIEIAKSLHNATNPSIIEALQELAADKDPAIRAVVASVLGEIASSVTLPALERLVKDPDRDVRQNANAAITAIREHFGQK